MFFIDFFAPSPTNVYCLMIFCTSSWCLIQSPSAHAKIIIIRHLVFGEQESSTLVGPVMILRAVKEMLWERNDSPRF